MYKELRLLKSQKRETHTFDASSLDDTNKELENYLVSVPRLPAADPVIALLDSATTHTILRSPEYFKFEGHRATWHTSDIVTIAGRRNFRYKEHNLQHRASCASSRSSTKCGKSTKCGAAMPELKRPLVGVANLGGSNLKTELGPRHLASSAYSMEIPARIQMWHNKLGHPGTTMFRRMLPSLAGHTVCPSDARKLEGCASCSQGKFIKQPSKWKLPSKLPEPLERL